MLTSHDNSLLKGALPVLNPNNLANPQFMTDGVVSGGNVISISNGNTLTYDLGRGMNLSHYVASFGTGVIKLELLDENNRLIVTLDRTGGIGTYTITELPGEVVGVRFVRVNYITTVTSTNNITEVNVWGKIPPTNKILLSSKEGGIKKITVDSYKDDLIPKMTSNTLPIGAAKASAEFSTSFKAWNAFDKLVGGGSGNCWAIPGGIGWLSYTFPSKTKVNSYTIKPRNFTGGNNEAPKNWTFEGSNDGFVNDINILDTRVNEIGWTLPDTRSYTFSSADSYSEYRINITANNGGVYTVIDELQMMRGDDIKVISIPSQSDQSFISHGMSQSVLASIDMSADFKEKHYIQDTSTVLGTGKVFEQVLDINKVIKGMKIL